MAIDYYRARLKHAQRTWLEDQGNPRRKDRLSGRAEKRRARQLESRDIRSEWIDVDPFWLETCDCPECRQDENWDWYNDPHELSDYWDNLY